MLSKHVACTFQFTSPFGDEQKETQIGDEFVLFQFTSPYGDEHRWSKLLCLLLHFNSRLLSETNFYRVWLVQKRCNFKSRFLAETNGFLLSGVLCQRISTHVSVRKRTVCLLQYMHFHILHFNSRLREGTNDHLGRRTGRVYGHFNSRLRKETNKRLNLALTSAGYFNSRLRKETNDCS